MFPKHFGMSPIILIFQE